MSKTRQYLHTCIDWWLSSGLPDDPKPKAPSGISALDARTIFNAAEKLAGVERRAG